MKTDLYDIDDLFEAARRVKEESLNPSLTREEREKAILRLRRIREYVIND